MKTHHSSATRVFGIVLAVAIAQCADAAEAEVGQAQFVRQAPVQVEPQPLPDLVAPLDPDRVKITDVRLAGRIEGRNITFSLELTATTKKSNVEIPLVLGGVVLDNVKKSTDKRRVRYDPGTKTYFMKWDRRGVHEAAITFAARPSLVENGPWRQCLFSIPSSQVRELELRADRTDLEILFPGALRVVRSVEDDELAITAILGPGLPFAVVWKPQVAELDAKLVLTGEANTIATAGAGAMGLDTLFAFDIAQGKLTEMEFAVPASLSVTQVRGRQIRDWRITKDGDAQKLAVILNRPQTKAYGLQVLSEMALPAFPAAISLPLISPQNARTGGHLAIGTNSAIHLLVDKTSGLSQIDASAFPRILLDREHPRRLPTAKAFCYSYAALPYQLSLSLDDIVPSYDASERLVMTVREDDLTVDVELELDVRDAPIRSILVEVPAGIAVADVSGADVEKDNYSVREPAGDEGVQEVDVRLRRPLLGRTLVKMRLELGKSPLDNQETFAGLSVRGAKNERGYIVVVAEKGIELDPPAQTGLREVHTGSVPMRVPDAQYAYRFRSGGWSLALTSHKEPSSVRVESFHLVSFGEGVLYGSVALTYFISGAPIDELYFRLPKDLGDVEFVGRDVSRWSNEDERWTVKLQRKIVGDYNLGITYNQRYEDGGRVLIGGVECDRVETQTGYIVVGSHLNVELTPGGPTGENLLAIKRDEVPAHYRLLVNAPILKTYKYIDAPHSHSLTVNAYERTALLPAVVEVMELSTDVDVREDGETESVTRIRYKVKNSSRQFLGLSIPEGAPVWSTHIIEQGSKGAERRVRVTASYDKSSGLLMIPLPRYRDPNKPATVELEYGFTHKKLGWSGGFRLVAPKNQIRSTFANWHITAPRNWAILPGSGAGANMVPEIRDVRQGDISVLMRSVLSSWSSAAYWPSRFYETYYCAGGVVIALLLLVLLKRRLVPHALIVVALAVLIIVGLYATGAPHFAAGAGQSDQLRTLRFTQVLGTDYESPLEVSACIVPAWRSNATFMGSVVIPVASIACLIIAAGTQRRQLRRALAALGFAGLVCAAGRFSVFVLPLSHLFTWGLPALAALWFVVRVLVRRPAAARVPSAAAALLLVISFIATGCSTTPAVPPRVNAMLVEMERVECQLTAEKDSMAVDMKLLLEVKKPMRFPVAKTSSILISKEHLTKDISIEEEDGYYVLAMRKKGRHEIDLKLVSPLPEADDAGRRAFSIHVPVALTNEVQLTVPEPGMQIEAPTAIRLTREEKEGSTIARAILGPGDDAAFIWRPRARQVELETTTFFSEVTSVMLFDTGLVEGRHRVHFQIAQGELKDIQVTIPEGMTVTAAEGNGLGTWRFDPAKRLLEAKLSAAARDEYVLTVTTQISAEGAPYSAAVGALQVEDALVQRGSLGIATAATAYIAVKDHPQKMNVDDFARDAAALLASWPAVKPADIRHAYRVVKADKPLAVDVMEVQPEIRTRENSVFTIADDRLVYNSELMIEIAKAGVFSVVLALPDGYDIDALGAAQISHWDESDAGGLRRTVQAHFKSRTLGQVALKLTLSRPEAELPSQITVPRVTVEGELKHTGRVLISSARGVRLLVSGRQGVSELNPVDEGIRQQGTLAFKLLKPDWQLTVQTEVLEPRVNVEFLHVARVTEGFVRHTHYLRYRLHNAGTKVFEFQMPAEARGKPRITGPDIARRDEVEGRPGRWRVELAHKWFDRPYLLKVNYETQFDRTAGKARIPPARALGADLQRGHVVVYATDRVELSTLVAGPSLEVHDARSLPRGFGAGDLSGAAFCYRSSRPNWELSFSATRHDAAALLEARVNHTSIVTVVNEFGESITQVRMQLNVNDKRHLETTLPPGAEIWSLLVNRRSITPSRKAPTNGKNNALLVPLAQAASGELPVEVELIYAMPAGNVWQPNSQMFDGPKFDLPLRNVSWQLYMPETFEYFDFGGTLTVNEEVLNRKQILHYDISAYDRKVQDLNDIDIAKAKSYQDQANRLAQRGEQYKARQAFENAYNYSQSDAALKEDARVQLQDLQRQQVLVGLLEGRKQLRRRNNVPEAQAQGKPDLGENFSQAEAESLRNSLGKDDSENLDLITEGIIGGQEVAAGQATHLIINTPLKGKLIQFERPLQVETNAEMQVSFAAKRAAPPRTASNWLYTGGLFILAFLVLTVAGPVRKVCSRKRNADGEDDQPPDDRRPPDEDLDNPIDDFEDTDDPFGQMEEDEDLPDEPEEESDGPTEDEEPEA